jgi:hypothetical protein
VSSQQATEEFMQTATLGFALTMSLATVGIGSVLIWLTFSWGWVAVGGIIALFLVYVLLQGPPSGVPLLAAHYRGFVPFLWGARIFFFLLILLAGAVLHKPGGASGWLIFLGLQLVVSPLLVLFAYKIRTSLLRTPFEQNF